MTRLEFEAIMKKMAVKHKMDECPEDMKEDYWQKSKHLTTDQFAKSLSEYFQTFTEKYNMPENGEEFALEAINFKRELSDLLKRMIERGAGQVVLKELAEHLGVEVDFDVTSRAEMEEIMEEAEAQQSIKNATIYENIVKQNEEKIKCPDAITPAILTILKGGKE